MMVANGQLYADSEKRRRFYRAFVRLWPSLTQRLLLGLLFFIPFQFYLNLGSAPVVVGYLALAGISLAFIPVVASRNWRIYISDLFVPLIFVAVTIALTVPRVDYYKEFFIKVAHLGIQVGLYFLVINLLTREDLIRRAVRVLIVSSLLSALLGVALYLAINLFGLHQLAGLMAHRLAPLLYGARAAEFFADGGYYSWIRPIPGQTVYNFRAMSLFVSPGENALFSTVTFFVVLALRQSFYRYRLSSWLLTLCILSVNVLLAQVRGVWVALFAGLVCYVLKQRLFLRPTRLFLLGLGLFLALSLGVLVLGVDNILVLFESIFVREDSSAVARLGTMQQGLEIARSQALLIGVGPGNDRAALRLPNADDFAGGTTHSMYLDLWLAIGGLGVLGYLWLMRTSWREATRIRQWSHSIFLREFADGYQCMWVALMVASIFQGNFFGNPKTNMLIWALMGLVSASKRIARNDSTIRTVI